MAKKNLPSTQQHLDIEDIRDDLLILKNGGVSLVLETTSLNFELFSDEEQDARILSFASLLNAVKFPLQIIVRTERTDVNDYIDKLKQYHDQHISEALRRQMEIYIKFIRNLTVKTEILNKRFFVVIPMHVAPLSKGFSFSDALFGKPKQVDVYKSLQRAKDELYPKRELVIKQFRKIGIKAWQLKTDELIQLFYDIYDPDKVGVKRVEIGDSDYTTGIVKPMRQELIDDLTKPVDEPKN